MYPEQIRSGQWVRRTHRKLAPEQTSCDPQGLRGRQNNADEGEREPSALPVCTQRQKEKSVFFDKKITQLNGKELTL